MSQEFKLVGRDVIIGVFDTRVWPESKSLNDVGYGPIPKSWKGQCETGTNFNESNCNTKLIGARYFVRGHVAANDMIDETKESNSPRDDDGHGTRTSTTASGSVVANASLFGFASGTAHGMALQARVAVYKVCWIHGCMSSDMLTGLDQAVADGVHVLSISLGGGSNVYYCDRTARETFATVQKGIFVFCSAGNSGPGPSTLSNVAPWITTVGVGTIVRYFPAIVLLGNRRKFSGVSLYHGKRLPKELLPLIYAANATKSTNGNLCKREKTTANSTLARGDILQKNGNDTEQAYIRV